MGKGLKGSGNEGEEIRKGREGNEGMGWEGMVLARPTFRTFIPPPVIQIFQISQTISPVRVSPQFSDNLVDFGHFLIMIGHNCAAHTRHY